MKPEVAFDKLKKLAKKTNIKNYVDLEKPHIKADEILINLIQELLKTGKQKYLGEKITKTFYKIKKWYA